MTTLREAAQQALEALELGYDSAKAEADQYHAAMAGYRPQRHAEMDADVQKIAAAITALRAALAEPVLNPAPGYCKHCKQYTIEEPLPAEPVQEPVAWVLALPDGRLDRLSVVTYDDEAEEMLQRSIAGCTLVPLYPAPPQRKPLTEEELWSNDEIMSLNADLGWHMETIRMFARAIERAHGITP